MKNYTINFLILLLVFGISFFPCKLRSQTNIPPEKPKLIIVLMIDDLSPQMVNRQKDKLGSNGLLRLIQNSASCINTHLGYLHQQKLSNLASAISGSHPSDHGIISNSWYNRQTGNMDDFLADNQYKTVGESVLAGHYSARNFPVSTFTDELEIQNNDSGKIIALAQNAQEAVLLANHAGDQAYWFDEVSGNWVSNTWFNSELPGWVSEFNNQKIQDIYLHKTWTPSIDLGKNNFSHSIEKMGSKPEIYSGLFSSPFGITFSKDFFLHCILSENLGQDEYTDVLLIDLSVLSNVITRFGSNSNEALDLLLQLDKEITHLLNFIDDEIGKENTLLVFGNPSYRSLEQEELEKHRIPHGTFDSEKAMVLLRAYLNALYGAGDWFLNYSNFMVYLNRDLIQDANLDLDIVQDKVSRFLMELSGVELAVPAHKLFLQSYSDGFMQNLSEAYNVHHSGDVIIQLQSGWGQKEKRKLNTISKVEQPVFLVWYGWKMKRQSIQDEVDIEDIAPTLSKILGIPFPNGKTGKVIKQIME